MSLAPRHRCARRQAGCDSLLRLTRLPVEPYLREVRAARLARAMTLAHSSLAEAWVRRLSSGSIEAPKAAWQVLPQLVSFHPRRRSPSTRHYRKTARPCRLILLFVPAQAGAWNRPEAKWWCGTGVSALHVQALPWSVSRRPPPAGAVLREMAYLSGLRNSVQKICSRQAGCLCRSWVLMHCHPPAQCWWRMLARQPHGNLRVPTGSSVQSAAGSRRRS